MDPLIYRFKKDINGLKIKYMPFASSLDKSKTYFELTEERKELVINNIPFVIRYTRDRFGNSEDYPEYLAEGMSILSSQALEYKGQVPFVTHLKRALRTGFSEKYHNDAQVPINFNYHDNKLGWIKDRLEQALEREPTMDDVYDHCINEGHISQIGAIRSNFIKSAITLERIDDIGDTDRSDSSGYLEAAIDNIISYVKRNFEDPYRRAFLAFVTSPDKNYKAIAEELGYNNDQSYRNHLNESFIRIREIFDRPDSD